MWTRLAVLLASLFTTAIAHAEAFGLKQGQPLSSLQIIRAMSGGRYAINVPEPNSEFASYDAIVSPTLGLCMVRGIGRPHEGTFGDEIRVSFKRMAASLDGIYGHHRVTDQLKDGSIWRDPKDFAMAIRSGDQSVDGFWDREDQSTMPANLNGIMLRVRAIGPSSTYLALSYEFANFTQCQREIDNAGL